MIVVYCTDYIFVSTLRIDEHQIGDFVRIFLLATAV